MITTLPTAPSRPEKNSPAFGTNCSSCFCICAADGMSASSRFSSGCCATAVRNACSASGTAEASVSAWSPICGAISQPPTPNTSSSAVTTSASANGRRRCSR